MVKRQNEILDIFNKEAKEIYDYLYRQSPQNANKFRQELKRKLIQIKRNPYAFSVEPQLPNKRKIYRRAIVMKSWKIVYRITKHQLTILGIAHGARNPSVIRSFRKRR